MRRCSGMGSNSTRPPAADPPPPPPPLLVFAFFLPSTSRPLVAWCRWLRKLESSNRAGAGAGVCPCNRRVDKVDRVGLRYPSCSDGLAFLNHVRNTVAGSCASAGFIPRGEDCATLLRSASRRRTAVAESDAGCGSDDAAASMVGEAPPR